MTAAASFSPRIELSRLHDVMTDSSEVDPLAIETVSETTAADERRRIRRRKRLLTGGFLALLCGLIGWAVYRPPVESAPTPTTKYTLDADRFTALIKEVREEGLEVVHVYDFKVNDQLCEQLSALSSVRTLILDRGDVTDAAMPVIGSLPNLQHLRLRLSPISDRGLEALAECDSLWRLNLPHSRVTAKGLRSLQSLPRLRQLRLGTTRAGNEVCRTIAKIESLREIHLIGINVTDEGMKLLAEMPNLESLYLDDSVVTDAGWRWLFATHPELHVHVNQEHHDRDPKAHRHHEGQSS